MKRLLNLKIEVEVQNEIQNRKNQCQEKRDLIEFVYKKNLT
jgi:hypothetical protein